MDGGRPRRARATGGCGARLERGRSRSRARHRHAVAGRAARGHRARARKAAERHAFVARLRPAAEADLAAGPRGSLLARAVIEQGAFELAHGDLHPFHCLLCVEEGLVATPEGERRSVVLRVARIAGRVAAVSPANFARQSQPPRRIPLAATRPPCSRRMSGVAWFARGSRTSRNSGLDRFRRSPPSSAPWCGGRSQRSPTTRCGVRRFSA